MANRKLTPQQENWLYLHFSDKTNRELAEELTEMIRKDNQKQLARLNHLLEEDFSESAKKIILRKIKTLEKFKGISESSIKRYARKLHCPRKSRMHIMICNQEKAKATNFKRWLKKAERVDQIAEWLRTFDLKDIRYCFIEDEGQLRSFRTSISKFNRFEGYERSIYLTSQYFSEVGLLRVNAVIYRTS